VKTTIYDTYDACYCDKKNSSYNIGDDSEGVGTPDRGSGGQPDFGSYQNAKIKTRFV
jgi:hypothetical protein